MTIHPKSSSMSALQCCPQIIQGGMGAGVSGWPLARAVSEAGQLGVVAGTALDVILSRRLQLGDKGGHMRRALAELPLPGVGERILERYFVSGGKAESEPFKAVPILQIPMAREQEELIIAGNFVEVYLARGGHGGVVGINYLEKIQAPTLPSLYGAMLAGVDYVLMGAGIPRAIPGILDSLAGGKAVEMRLDVRDSTGEFLASFDPAVFFSGELPPIERPKFLGIVASVTVASMLCRKASGRVDGLIIEGPTAGGHNAPPRGKQQLDGAGEPVYSERDSADISAIAALGVPFWLAGSYGSAERLREALELGAAGVQVGTAFAYCEESGLADDIKKRVLAMSRAGTISVFTDPNASPTGFPFKVLELEGTQSDWELADARSRTCDLGYLRQAFERPDGSLGWRCAGEPVKAYLKKGGTEEDTTGKKCVCNGLLANVGLGQVRHGEHELPLITSGNDVATISRFPAKGANSYSARDVIDQLVN